MIATAEAIKELYPLYRCVVWDDGSVVCDDDAVIDRAAVDALAVVKRATAQKETLKKLSSLECLNRICAIVNPLDGQPLSTRTSPDQMRTDALVGWANAKDAAASNPALAPAVDAAVTERFRLLSCHTANKSAIDAGTLTTEAQVLDPARW